MKSIYYIIWFFIGYSFIAVPVEIVLQEIYGPGFYTGITMSIGIVTAGLAGHIQNKRLRKKQEE